MLIVFICYKENEKGVLGDILCALWIKLIIFATKRRLL